MDFLAKGFYVSLLLGSASALPFHSCGVDRKSTSKDIYLLRADQQTISDDEQLAVMTYAGVLARDTDSPLLAVIQKDNDMSWFTSMVSMDPSVRLSDVHSLDEVLTKLPCNPCSFALSELDTDAVSAALSFAAATENCLVATTSTKDVLEAHNLTQVMDLRGAKPDWALRNSSLSFNPQVTILQAPAHPVHLADMGIKCRAMFWWGDEGDCKSSSVASEAISRLESSADTVALGWGGGDDPEWGCVHSLSARGTSGIIASDFALNLAALSSVDFDLSGAVEEASRTKVARQSSSSSSSSPSSSSSTPKHTVTFLMSDGDNLQWVLNQWGSPSPDSWWNSPSRGLVPLGWTLPPSLPLLAPSVLASLLSSRTPNDSFVAGPSGAAYAFPNDFPSHNSSVADDNARASADLAARSGMSIVNVIADDGSPDDVGPLLAGDNGDVFDAVFLYEFSGYSNLGGSIDIVEGKPVIGGRFSLWSPEFYNGTTLAEALRALPNMEDVTSSDGYSLIPVHAWSHGVDDVRDVAEALRDDGRFDVVSPEEFVDRIVKRVVG